MPWFNFGQVTHAFRNMGVNAAAAAERSPRTDGPEPQRTRRGDDVGGLCDPFSAKPIAAATP